MCDPNVKLAEFLAAVRNAETAYVGYTAHREMASYWEQATLHAQELIEWLAAGGAAPNWKSEWNRHQLAQWREENGDQ